jgi:hypothetical protein
VEFFSANDLTTVVPGWSEGPDPESRDSGFVLCTPRNDETKHGLHYQQKSPGKTGAFRIGKTPT